MSGGSGSSGGGGGKPHAVCVPIPYQSHIKVMLTFAKLLHRRGFHVTFVNTDFNHRRLLRSRGPAALDGLPDFRFLSFPDGLPASDPDASQTVPAVLKAVQTGFLAPFLHLVTTRLYPNTPPSSAPATTVPPPTCIVADTFMSFAHAAGEQLGIPVMCLTTVSASALMGVHQYRPLKEKGYSPVTDPRNLRGLDILMDWVPGLKNIRLRDILTNFRDDEPDAARLFNFSIDAVELAAAKASAMIINTVEDLERDALNGLGSIYRRVYPIGPIHLFLNQIPPQSPVTSIGSNLWKEESECLPWLDSQPPASVVYVNFGSVAVAAPEDITELAWGLAGCNRSFLWAVRPDLLAGGISSPLPPEIRDRTRGSAFITSWCPQEEVLDHASVGAFLTHCGWNSTVESASSGVPMICRPFAGDQRTNCRYVCAEWRVGVEMEGEIKREDVVRAVREVMEGEEGRRMQEKAAALKKAAHAAAGPKGSSAMNLEKVLREAFSNFRREEQVK